MVDMNKQISARTAATHIMNKFKIHEYEIEAITRYLLRTRPEGVTKYTRERIEQMANHEPLLSYLAKKSEDPAIRALPNKLEEHIERGQNVMDRYRTNLETSDTFPWAHPETPWNEELLRSEIALNMLHGIYKKFMGAEFDFEGFTRDYRKYWKELTDLEVVAQIPPNQIDQNDYSEGETPAEDRALRMVGEWDEQLSEQLRKLRTGDYRKAE